MTPLDAKGNEIHQGTMVRRGPHTGRVTLVSGREVQVEFEDLVLPYTFMAGEDDRCPDLLLVVQPTSEGGTDRG